LALVVEYAHEANLILEDLLFVGDDLLLVLAGRSCHGQLLVVVSNPPIGYTSPRTSARRLGSPPPCATAELARRLAEEVHPRPHHEEDTVVHRGRLRPGARHGRDVAPAGPGGGPSRPPPGGYRRAGPPTLHAARHARSARGIRRGAQRPAGHGRAVLPLP